MLFILCILVCLAAGAIGSFATAKNIPTWYRKLKKPAFNPPNWIFAPVWTTLYILMGISLFLVFEYPYEKHVQLTLFGLQLLLNILWSFIFFSWHNIRAAFIEILVLWLVIAATIFTFWQINSFAAILLLPYICWVSFAAYLNYSVAKLNS